MKKQDFKKMFSDHIFDKGLMSRIYKEHSKLKRHEAIFFWKEYTDDK